jgi:hypothetical protein
MVYIEPTIAILPRDWSRNPFLKFDDVGVIIEFRTAIGADAQGLP